MADPVKFLKYDPEEMPEWLVKHRPNGRFPRCSFFNSRVVFYPCSGMDGHPLIVFGKSHAAHSFVYADYCTSKAEVVRALTSDDPNEAPAGYTCMTLKPLNIRSFFPDGWTPTYAPDEWSAETPAGGNFILWAVLQRKPDRDASHGPERLSILHFGFEYMMVFERLFCQANTNMCYAVLIDQPSGNWTNMGGNSCYMWQLLRRENRSAPPWLFVENTFDKPWPGYMQASKPHRDKGNYRALFSCQLPNP